LTDSIYLVRKSCVAALDRIKSATSIPVLAQALSDDRFEVRLTAYQALLDFDSLAYPQVLALLRDAPSNRVEAMAVRLAGVLEIADAAAHVKNRLTADDAVVRGWACWSYARLGATASELETMLADEQDDFVKSQLATSLEYLRNYTADE
jgi:HEAT repeat protein